MSQQTVRISGDFAPALGDMRQLPSGTTVHISSDAVDRYDWPRYIDAIGAAVSRGVDVRWVRG